MGKIGKPKKAKAQPKIKLIADKGASNAVMKYRKLRAAGKIGKVGSLEELSKWFTKKGTVKKRETRYNKGREEFNKAVEKMRKDVGGKNPAQKRITDRARFEKAQETYKKNNTKDKRFKKQAREKANQYTRMVEVFASETFKELREGEYGLGSDIVEALAEQGLEPDEIIDYLNRVRRTYDSIPNEAKRYREQDDFWNMIIGLSDMINNDMGVDMQDIIYAYVGVDGDIEYFRQALENYINRDDKPPLSFTDTWTLLNETQDPASLDNMNEIFEEFRV